MIECTGFAASAIRVSDKSIRYREHGRQRLAAGSSELDSSFRLPTARLWV
jgi:hypothetical protein